MASPLVSTQWLAERLGNSDVRAADASWYLPQAQRNARAEYEAAHVPGAVFFNIDALSDPRSQLPHMLPEPDVFAEGMRALGIGSKDFVVLYDGAGVYSSPRAWWMLHAMGHERCAVLDGGLPKWRREGRPLQAATPVTPAGRFDARLRGGMVRDFGQVRANLTTRREQLVDARSPARFRGEEAEPRPGVRPGRIPGSFNVYYAELVTPEGTMRPAEELRQLFAARGVDIAKPVVTSCGSGVTAAIVSLALALAGASETALYDGSWAEWGARADAPIEVGAAR